MKEGVEAEGTVRLTHQGPECLCRGFRFDFSCSGDLVAVSSRMVEGVFVCWGGQHVRKGAVGRGSFLGCSWAPTPAHLPPLPTEMEQSQ